jgi:hypothetical protein
VSEREPGARDEDELWRSIVDNYGDRPELTDEDVASLTPAAAPGGAPEAAADEPGPDLDEADEADAFVPPTPPPVPLPRGPRLVAWSGVLLGPVLMLLAALTRVTLPPFVGLAAVAWVVGGFGYLVATMPRGPRDPGDDGAVV